jgi:CheY-like chemotaxis protein
MSLVMVVDDMAVVREPIAASLRASGYQTVSAGGGLEALNALQIAIPDLILLDLSMPGMDGMTVLRALRKSSTTAHTPVILLTASADKGDVVEASRLGVRDYVLKSRFSLPEMLARVGKYLCPPNGAAALSTPVVASVPKIAKTSDIPRLLDRKQCIERAKQALQARTLSGVVAQVISLAASPRGDLSQLASLIARDPLLSGRVLQAANSVNYTSTRGAVSTIPEAVKNIGCPAVRGIAAAMGVFDAMPPSDAAGLNAMRCWQHSVAVATLCDRLAPETERGSAYLVGLCHDLGEILFHTHFGAEYQQLVEIEQITGKTRAELERTMLGITHGELAQTILQCLGLPDVIRAPLLEYHADGFLGRGGGTLPRLLRLADLYANGLSMGSSRYSAIAPIARVDARATTGQDHPPRPDAIAFRGEILALTALLARSPTQAEAPFTAIPPRRPVRLWLARDSFLSSFDPILAALEVLAEVTVRDGLPTAREAAEHSALVVVARSTSAKGFTETDLKNASTLANASPLPLLWLTGRADPGAIAIPPMLWPVSLPKLAEFVAAIE